MPFRSTRPVLMLVAALLLFPACSVLERTTDEESEPGREVPAEGERPDEEAGPRTVQGFRIQVLTTEDKSAADQRAAELEERWGSPVEVAWKAPYYRVRLGAFASRSAAQSKLEAVQEQYPGALLVPSTVTIYPN